MSVGNPLSEHEFEQLVLSVGTGRHRRHLSPMQVARFLKRGLDYGVTTPSGVVPLALNQLTSKLGLKSPTMIRQFLRLFDIPEELQDFIGWGGRHAGDSHLTFSIASAASELELEARNRLIQSVFQYDLKKDEVLETTRLLRRNPGMSLDVALQTVLSTRPQKIVREVLVGHFENEWKPEQDSPVRRQRAMTETLSPIFRNEPLEVKVSGERFLILTSPEGKSLLEQAAAASSQDLNTFVISRTKGRDSVR